MLGQEAVEGKSNGSFPAIPVLLDRLSEGGSLKGALVSIDAIATNAKIAQAIMDKGADSSARGQSQSADAARGDRERFRRCDAIDTFVDPDKGHGRIEQRSVSVITEVDWLEGEARRFPGEPRLPSVATIIRVKSRAELSDRGRLETRYYVSSARLSAKRAGEAVRGHWGIENQSHWVLDVVFAEDQSRLRKGHGARNMAVLVEIPRSIWSEPPRSPRSRLLSNRNARRQSPHAPASSSAEKSPDGEAIISP